MKTSELSKGEYKAFCSWEKRENLSEANETVSWRLVVNVSFLIVCSGEQISAGEQKQKWVTQASGIANTRIQNVLTKNETITIL